MYLTNGLDHFIDWRTLLIVALIFIPLERLVARDPHQKLLRKGWVNDLVYLTLNGMVVKLGLMLLVGGFMLGLVVLIPSSVGVAVRSQPLWLQVVEVIVIADAGFYLAHRAFHAVPWLWRFHAIHHSIEELDWLAAARVHPLDQVLTKSASLLPVFALGYSEVAIAVFVGVFQFHAFFIHANTRVNIGPLKWLIASPDFHHWHHANERAAYDKNFAGQLPIFDMIGATLHLPGDQRFPTKYGVDQEIPDLYLNQLAHPFRKERAKARKRA